MRLHRWIVEYRFTALDERWQHDHTTPTFFRFSSWLTAQIIGAIHGVETRVVRWKR